MKKTAPLWPSPLWGRIQEFILPHTKAVIIVNQKEWADMRKPKGCKTKGFDFQFQILRGETPYTYQLIANSMDAQNARILKQSAKKMKVFPWQLAVAASVRDCKLAKRKRSKPKLH